MRRSTRKFAIAATALAAATVMATASPAHAVYTPIAHTGTVIAVAGSDTTEEFVARWFQQGTGQPGPANGDYSIPSRPGISNPTTPFVVPGDADCTERTYVTAPAGPGQTVAPNGSSAGINALINTPGCVDIARSSRGEAPADPAGLNFFAYAMDHLWVASPSFNAPATLSLDQVRAIFRCDAAADTWGEVGGVNPPAVGGVIPTIKPFIPQPGSGTGPHFIAAVLGGDANVGPCVSRETQEHTGKDPFMTDADYQMAITPYSTSQWIFQDINKANPSLDLRNGMHLIAATGACGAATPTYGATYNGIARRWLPNPIVYSEANAQSQITTPGNGCATRFIYHVTRDGSPQQTLAEQYVGHADPDGAGPLVRSKLCTPGQAGADLSAVGFATLPADGTGSSCRLFEST